MIDQIKEEVKAKYTEVLTTNQGCGCGPSCCDDNSSDSLNESYEQLDGYFEDADYSLGCGIPTEFAKISAGQTVLDLGSGAGNDAFVAQRLVGEQGKVIGVDMTEAMIHKANENKVKLGLNNVEFYLGEIENLPLSNETIDVAISNCVMNLVPDKLRAYQEVFRVLKKGGHFSISDMVYTGIMPAKIEKAAALYTGCISGALEIETYLQTIKEAGFTNLEVVKQKVYPIPDEYLQPHLDEAELKAFRASNTEFLSITVVAEKPCCAPDCCN